MSRKHDSTKYRNDASVRRIADQLSKMTGLSPNMFNHVGFLYSLGMIHELAIKARKSDKRVTEIEMEIPFIGLLKFHIEDKRLVVDGIMFEDEFTDRINRAVTNGESDLISVINKKYEEKIKKRYNEII